MKNVLEKVRNKRGELVDVVECNGVFVKASPNAGGIAYLQLIRGKPVVAFNDTEFLVVGPEEEIAHIVLAPTKRNKKAKGKK